MSECLHGSPPPDCRAVTIRPLVANILTLTLLTLQRFTERLSPAKPGTPSKSLSSRPRQIRTVPSQALGGCAIVQAGPPFAAEVTKCPITVGNAQGTPPRQPADLSSNESAQTSVWIAFGLRLSLATSLRVQASTRNRLGVGGEEAGVALEHMKSFWAILADWARHNSSGRGVARLRRNIKATQSFPSPVHVMRWPSSTPSRR